MNTIRSLGLSWRRQVPVVLQTEVAECGLACLVMVAGYYGAEHALNDLRRRFPVSTRGTSMGALVRLAMRLQLSGRPVKLDLDGLRQLRLPCILHWEFQHFVVLTTVSERGITVHDPASGVRKVSWKAVSDAFTGVALELTPNQAFGHLARDVESVPLRRLLGRITGLRRSVAQIALIALCVEFLSLVSPFFLQITIDQVLSAQDVGLLVVLAVAFGLMMALHQLFSAARSWMIIHLSTLLSVQWRVNVFGHLIQLPITFFERRHVGDIASRFASIEAIQRTLTASFIETLIDGVMVIFTLGMMFLYSWWLPWVSTFFLVCYALARYLALGPMRSATTEQLIHAARQHSHFLETLRGARAFKLFDGTEERRTAWVRLLVAQTNSGLAIEKIGLVTCPL